MADNIGERKRKPYNYVNGFHKYRDVFFASNGLGPWPCFFCLSLVEYGDHHIHHVDGNHGNVDPDNLVPAHKSCHLKYDIERKRKIGVANAVALRGKKLTAEHRANIKRGLLSHSEPWVFSEAERKRRSENMRQVVKNTAKSFYRDNLKRIVDSKPTSWRAECGRKGAEVRWRGR